jgi:hypothetical protein
LLHFSAYVHQIAIILLCFREVAAGRVVEPLRDERAGVGQRRVESGLMLFEVCNELPANRDHRLEQRLANLVADERIGGIDDVAIADAVFIFKRGATVGQCVGGDHALVIGVVLVEANQSCEQGDAKLLKRGVVGVGAAPRIDVAEEDTRIAEHMAAGAGVNGSVVRNGAGLPVLSRFNGLLDDGVDLVSQASSAGIGGDVAEELIQVGFAQALEFAAIISAGSLWGKDEVGPAADDLRIEACKIKNKEGGLVGGDPGILDVVVLKVGEIILNRSARSERLLHAHIVFLGEWVLFLAKAHVGPCKAEKERVERLPLGLVMAHDRDDAGKGEHMEATVGESEIATKEMAGSAPKTCVSCECD